MTVPAKRSRFIHQHDGTTQDNPDFVQSLAKGLEILSAFSGGSSLGNQQLVKLTGLPKATVSRLTTTLVTLGYLQPLSLIHISEPTRPY